jgi:hypothetical protein
MKRCFKVSKCHAKSFSASQASKKAIWRSHLTDVLSRRMALRIHNLSSGRLQKRLMKSMKRCFKVPKGHSNSFSVFWESNKATWTNSIKWCFKYADGLRTQNLPSGRLKRRLWRRGWSDVSRCRRSICTHFLHLGNRKWLSWSRLNDVLNRRMALRIKKLPSAHLKRRLWRSRWIKVLMDHAKTFSASPESQKVTFTISLKWCYK